MKSPEGTSVPKELPADNLPNVEQSKLPKDRDYWWQWLIKSEREIQSRRVNAEVIALGDTEEFSELLSNLDMARILAELESERLSPNSSIVEMPFQNWSHQAREAITSNQAIAHVLDYLTQEANENWTLFELCQVAIEFEAQPPGFTGRYWIKEKLSEIEITERSIAIGAYLLEQVLEQQQWDNSIDALLVSSTVLPETISLEIIKFAQEKGILGETESQMETRDIRTACSGSSLALLIAAKDILINKKKRAVLLALEPLGDLLRHHEGSWRLGISGLTQFGNAFKALGFNPQTTWVPNASQLHVENDAVQIARFYQIASSDQEALEYWLRWIGGDTEHLSIFSTQTHHQVFALDIDSPKETNIAMHYGKSPSYPRIVRRMMQKAQEQFRTLMAKEGITELEVGSNQADQRMTRMLNAEASNLIGTDSIQLQSRVFSPNKANTGSAGMIDALIEAGKVDGMQLGDKKKNVALLLLATAIGASVLAAFVYWKSQRESLDE